MRRKNIAIILSAGLGLRSGFTIPKQLVKLCGKKIIEYCLIRFNNNSLIDEIIIVSNSKILDSIANVVKQSNLLKVKHIIIGGDNRFSSTNSAIEYISSYSDLENCNLIFHDAVRPLISDRVISNVISRLDIYGAVDVAVPATDTIIRVDNLQNEIVSIPKRDEYYSGQTPQGFRYSIISKAYNLALINNDLNFTDDCGVVLKYLPEVKISVVIGDSNNIKLTYNTDLPILDKLIQIDSSLNTNHDVEFQNLSQKVIVIFGGNSGIGAKIKEFVSEFDSNVYAFSRLNNVDVTNIAQINSALEYVYSRHGKIDYVINTTGILYRSDFNLMSFSDINDIVSVNFLGTINVSKCSFKYLDESKGHLLNFASSSYTYGRSKYSIYSSTKAAVVNFSQALSDEWSIYGIKVNCISPERTMTRMRLKAFGEEDPSTLLNPEVVALETIKLLLTEKTGHIIDVKL